MGKWATRLFVLGIVAFGIRNFKLSLDVVSFGGGGHARPVLRDRSGEYEQVEPGAFLEPGVRPEDKHGLRHSQELEATQGDDQDEDSTAVDGRPEGAAAVDQAPQGDDQPDGAEATEHTVAAPALSSCPRQAHSPHDWHQPPTEWLKHIKAYGDKSSVTKCERWGDALIFHVDARRATHIKGNAFELLLPDYIVADELSGGWREKRSTLQLFLTNKGLIGKPLGPPHAAHETIAENGDGAYSHWREPITDGPGGKSHLRFSLPRSESLKNLAGLIAVVFPMAPPMGWVEFASAKKVKHQETFRELYFRTFPTVGAEPHVIVKPEDTRPGTWYFWRIGGNHEFELPVKEGALYERELPRQISEYYGQFEDQGGKLFPPPQTYLYYQNKVGLAELFKNTHVRTPKTWVFRNLKEALAARKEVTFPVVVKDPYGFSSHGIQQASSWDEFTGVIRTFFESVAPGIEAIVQQKIVALREARVTYIDGRPFHGYWRTRKSLDSASAASNLGGYQSFDFPLKEIAGIIQKFANDTRMPVGGVDFIWEEEEPDVHKEPFTLEVSPTSDLNPASPRTWHKTYKEFKLTAAYRPAFIAVRRQWTEMMTLAVIDRYRRARRDMFVDIDNVVSLSAARVLQWKGKKEAYSAREVLKDAPVPDAAAALRELRGRYLVRFLTARGSYENAFNVTKTWLDAHGFEYDELIVVKNPVDKLALLTAESVLVDDFTTGHEKPQPDVNTKFMEELRQAGLPYIVFPFGGAWADILPQLK